MKYKVSFTYTSSHWQTPSTKLVITEIMLCSLLSNPNVIIYSVEEVKE